VAEYDRAIASALRMITKKGMPIQIVRTVPGPEISPGRPGPAQTPIVIDTVGVFLPAELQQMRTLQELIGTNVPIGFEVAYIPKLPIDLVLTDVIRKVTGQDTHNVAIFKVDALAPAGDTVLNVVWVQK